MTVSFTAFGKPVPKARPRVARYSTYTPQSTTDYEKLIADAWKRKGAEMFPENTPLEIEVHAYFPIPTSLSKKKQNALHEKPHLKRGDLDNVVKSILDALNELAFKDDSAVYSIKADKHYAFTPRTEITITDRS